MLSTRSRSGVIRLAWAVPIAGFFACGGAAPCPFMFLAIGGFVHTFVALLSIGWPQSWTSLRFSMDSLFLTSIGTLVAYLRDRPHGQGGGSSSDTSLERTREG